MDKANSLEQKKLELEEQKLERESQLKGRELELREKELEAKREEQEPKRVLTISSFSPTTIAAIIGLVATGVGFIVQSNNSRELEREKLQSQLILKAIETGDPEKALANLQFFLDTGLLDDPTGRITKAVVRGKENPGSIPVLPERASQSLKSDEERFGLEQLLILTENINQQSKETKLGEHYYRRREYDEAIFQANIVLKPKNLLQAYPIADFIRS